MRKANFIVVYYPSKLKSYEMKLPRLPNCFKSKPTKHCIKFRAKSWQIFMTHSRP